MRHARRFLGRSPAWACCLFALECLSGPSVVESVYPPPADPQTVATRAVLERALPAGARLTAGFSDWIDYLRDVSGAYIFVNWKALGAAGVDRNTPVTDDFSGQPLNVALERLLAAAGGKTALGWDVDEWVITISTRADLAPWPMTRVYDVRDLLSDKSDLPGTGGGTAGAHSGTPVTARQQAMDDLVARIGRRLDPPASPNGAGGFRPLRVKELSGQLVVTETPENQVRVLGFLESERLERRIVSRALATGKWLVPGLISGWLVLRPLRRRRVARRRATAGLCAGCGYDLRYSPSRCPECGAARTGG